MGLSLALMVGKENFDSFRIGAKNMDQHFYKATVLQNLPIIMALISIWNRTFLNFPTQLVVHYSSALDNLVLICNNSKWNRLENQLTKMVPKYAIQHLALFGVVQDLTPSMLTSNFSPGHRYRSYHIC